MYIPLMASVYFARWLLLDTGDILENGAIAVDGNIIAGVGPRSKIKRSSADRIINLGDALVLPGFINLHTHLEECMVRGASLQPGETFASFSAKKNARVKQASEVQLRAGIKLEVSELLSQGITSLLDSSRLGFSAKVLAAEPVRSWVEHEIHAEDLPQEENAADFLQTRIASCDEHIGLAIGPHAIYSLSPPAQRKLLEFAASKEYLWAVHVAESAEELQAFSERKGDLYFHITRKKPWPFGEASQGPMHTALTASLIPSGAICFHCNYASGYELSLLAAKRASVVHCFQYSEMLGHKRFPLEVALNRHVPICLGTEGIAAVGQMNLFDELFALKNAYPHIAAGEMLRWVTQNPANALRAGSHLGSLTEGKLADLIAVRFPHDPQEELLETLITSDVEMALVMVDGQEVIADY
jgi:cytosine/adenosine deaminase-related metal-dependent hydrolase